MPLWRFSKSGGAVFGLFFAFCLQSEAALLTTSPLLTRLPPADAVFGLHNASTALAAFI